MKITKISSEGIEFDDGIKVEDYHSQDCCESVWADWDALSDYDLIGFEIDDLLNSIEIVPDGGFRIAKHFVPCYNQQNGYYSSSLELRITYPDKLMVVTIDLSEGVQDQIN